MKKCLCLIVVAVMIATLSITPCSTSVAKAALSDNISLNSIDNEVSATIDGVIDVSTGPSKWALLIGIADYKGTTNDLWHPDEDAKELYTELTRQQGYQKTNVKILTNKAATETAILAGIDWLIANEKAGDEVVFFFGGHGSSAGDSIGWDSDVEADHYDEAIVSYDLKIISDGKLAQKFSSIESTKFAMLFGSCYSGGMFDDDNDLKGEGRVIVTACAADQYGWDYLQLGNTLWGYYFIDEGLVDNKASSIEEAYDYCYPRVVAIQPESQPQIFDNYDGEFTL